MRATAKRPAGDANVGAQHAAPLPGDVDSRIAPRYAEVVLPVPVPRTYTYLVPPELEPRVVPGARVVVPVQRRQVVGVVAAVDAPPPAPTVTAKPVLAAPGAPRHPLDESSRGQRFQSLREDGAGKFEMGGEVVEALHAVEGVAKDQQRPPLADDLETARQRACDRRR